MSKLCAVKGCSSNRKSKRKKALLQLSYFQPTTKAKLENWRKSLGFNVKKTDFICHLHFREEHIKFYNRDIIDETMYYSFLHKKLLKKEAVPTIKHQYCPPPQTSISTETKVEELSAKEQTSNNIVKNIEQVNLQNQVHIDNKTSHNDLDHSTAFPGLLVGQQAYNYSTDNTEHEEIFQEQTEKQFEQNNLPEQNFEYMNSEDQNLEDMKSEDQNLEDMKSDDQNLEGMYSEDQNLEGMNLEEMNSEDMNSEDMNSEDMNSEDQNMEDMKSDDQNLEDQNLEGMNLEEMNSEDQNLEDMNSEDQNSEDQNSEYQNSEYQNSEDQNSEDQNSEDQNSEDQNSEDQNSEDQNSEDQNSEDQNSEDKNSEDQTQGQECQQTQQLVTPGLEPYSNIGFQEILVDPQGNNYSVNYINSNDSYQMQMANQIAQNNLELQSGGTEHQQPQIVQFITPEQVPQYNIDVPGWVMVQPAQNYAMNYIEPDDMFQKQIANQIVQNDSAGQRECPELQQTQQIQIITPGLETYGNIGVQGLLVNQQDPYYNINYIKTGDTLQNQIENQFTQNNLQEQGGGPELQQPLQIQVVTPQQKPNCNIEVQGLPAYEPFKNCSVNYKNNGNTLQEPVENQFPQNDLGVQWKEIDNQQTEQIQIATPKQQPLIEIQPLIVNRQDYNETPNSLISANSPSSPNFPNSPKSPNSGISADRFQDQTESEFDQSDVDNLEEEEEEIQEPDNPFDNLKKKFAKFPVLPPYWFYADKSERIEVMRIDPTDMQIKNHLRLNEDLSITVIFLSKEEFKTKDKVTHNNFNSYLQSVEEWPICVGTLIDKKFSDKCKGVIMGEEKYKRLRKEPRCKACRSLRNQLHAESFQVKGPKYVRHILLEE